MSSHGLVERLEEIVAPPGYTGKWADLIACADDDLRNELLSALEHSSAFYRTVIIATVTDGSGRNYILGTGGTVSNAAKKFIRFVLCTVDVAIRAASAQQSELRAHVVSLSLRRMYGWIAARIEKGEIVQNPTEQYLKAAVLAQGISGVNLNTRLDEIAYFAEHYDALEPYLDFIIASGDMSRSQVNMLITTSPLVPLVGGAL